MFAGQRHRAEAAIHQAGVQTADRFARAAEQHRRFRFVKAQQVDHRIFCIRGCDGDRLIGDIAMTAIFANRGNAQRIILIAFGKIDNRLRDGRREHQCPAILAGRVEYFFEIFAKAHVEHFIGFVEHRCTEIFEIKRAAFEMIAQTARGANDDMCAAAQLTPFLRSIHTPDTGCNLGTGGLIQPGQFATNLQGQFAGWRDDQRQRFNQKRKTPVVVEQLRRHRQTEGNGLAGTGLGRNDKVAAFRFGFKHGGLNRSRLVIFARRERLCEKRGNFRERHNVCIPWQK